MPATTPTSHEKFRELVEEHARRGLDCSTTELNTCYKLSEAILYALRVRTHKMRSDHQERALMQVYMSDGWSAFTTDRVRLTCGNVTVQRNGRQKLEFLLERGMLRARRPCGKVEFCMLPSAPRGLRAGRTAWNMFTAASEFWPSLRCSGHKGIAISVYNLDGALVDSTVEKCEALHELYYDESQGFVAKEDVKDLKNSEWPVKNRCKIHAAHKSIEWGLKPINTEETQDNCHIGVKSLLNSSSLIHEGLDEWLLTFVHYCNPTDTDADIAVYWKRLGAKDHELPLMMEVDPVWDPVAKRLCVRKRLQHDRRGWLKTRMAVLICRQWVNWSDARWGKISPSGRLFTRSIATGVGSQVNEFLRKKTGSKSGMPGFTKIGYAERLLMAVAVFSADSIEKLIIELLKDDRLLRYADGLLQLVHDRIESIADSPQLVWDRIASAVGADPADLEHESLMAMMTTYGFAYRETFRDIFIGGLGMTQGDIVANVRNLAVSVAPPADNLQQRMKNMLDDGATVDGVVEGVELLRDAPMSTAVDEEGHALSACLARDHKRLTEKGLRVRSVLAALKYAVRTRGPPKHVPRIQVRLKTLSKRRHGRVYGNHMFFRKMVAAHRGRKKSSDVMKESPHFKHGEINLYKCILNIKINININ